MRANIRDIIEEMECTEVQAGLIEDQINEDFALDWSECTRKEFREEVRHAALVLKRKGVNVYNDTDGKERLRGTPQQEGKLRCLN